MAQKRINKEKLKTNTEWLGRNGLGKSHEGSSVGRSETTWGSICDTGRF